MEPESKGKSVILILSLFIQSFGVMFIMDFYIFDLKNTALTYSFTLITEIFRALIYARGRCLTHFIPISFLCNICLLKYISISWTWVMCRHSSPQRKGICWSLLRIPRIRNLAVFCKFHCDKQWIYHFGVSQCNNIKYESQQQHWKLVV